MVWQGRIDTWYVHDGVMAALQDLIIENVPKVVIEALEDEETGFANVTPRELLEHIFKKAKINDTRGISKLLKERDQPIDFEGDMALETFFEVVDKAIKKLKKMKPPVETSETNLHINWLLQIETYAARPHNKGRAFH